MSVRYYANAPATTLASSCSDVATTLDLTSVTGLPIQYPYTLILDRGTPTEEVVEVSNAAGTSLTVTRHVDGTTAFAHASGATVEHGISARDIREPNAHIAATADVHGVTGDLFGADDAVALTHKDLSSNTNTFPAALATDSEVSAAAAAAQSAAISSANSHSDGALAAHEADTSTHGVGEIVGRTETQTLTNKTLTSPVITEGGKSAFVPTDGTSGSRPSSPTSGQTQFDTDTGQIVRYNGTSWVPIGGRMPKCHLQRSSQQTIPSLTTTPIQWNSEVEDLGGWHSGSSDQIVVPYTGWYGIQVLAGLQPNTAFDARMTGVITVNGTQVKVVDEAFLKMNAETNNFVVRGWAELHLTAGDIVRFGLFQSNNSASRLTDDANTTPEIVVRYLGA